MQSKLRSICLIGLALLVAIVLFGPSQLKAQGAGSIVGTVTDSSGALVPGATVTVTNSGTNETRTMKSNAAGDYQFVNLLPAVYKVEVQAASFKRFVSQGTVVQTGSASRVNAVLQVGATTETVEVDTQAPLLQTESGTLGSQVEGKTVEAMPLNGRNTMALIALVPGVVPQGSTSGPAAMNQGDHTNSGGWGNYQIGGSIAGHGVIFVDGAPVNTLGSNGVGFIPTQDAIQEFKVSTSAVSPEFGRFAGGVVEMTTKSGGNAFHGAAYEYLRNTVLDANTYGTNQANASIVANGGTAQRQPLHQNQYGVVVSGPIKKNKAFFMFSWEGFRNLQGLTQATNIPDAGMMSNTDPSVPNPLTNPASVLTGAGNLWAKTGKYAGSCVQAYNAQGDHRTHIDPACIDPAANILKKYFPSTSSPFYDSTKGVGQNNFNSVYGVGDNANQYNGRGDIKLSDKQQLFVRYSYVKMKDKAADIYGHANGFDTSNAGSKYFTHQGVIGDTYTVNPTTIADVRLSYMRSYGDDIQGSNGTQAAADTIKSLGTGWAPVTATGNPAQLPKLSLGGGGRGQPPAGYYNLYGFMPMFLWDMHYNDGYALTASVVKIKGNHTLKFGGEIRFLDAVSIGTQNPDTTISTSNRNYAQDEWANLLLGLPDNIQIGTGQPSGAFNWYQGYYGADTWAVNRKLTVSAGLRWELPGGVAERHDNSTVLSSDTFNGIKGTMLLVNSPQWSYRTTEPALHNLFSPRLGFAYRLNNNTVIRAGYALTYLAPDMGGVSPSSSPVVSASTQASNDPHAAYYTVANPFGTGTAAALAIQKPVGRSWGSNFISNFQTVNHNNQVSGPAPTNKLSYMQQWNLVVGQQFKGSQSVEVSFAGALAIHLLPSGGTWELDQPNAAQFAQIKACTGTCDPRQYTSYPNYRDFTNANPYIGTMNYNSLQVRYEKRLGGGGLITSGYTFSKSLGNSDTAMPWLDSGADGSIQDYSNIKGEHSLLSYSMKNRWVTSYVVNLPLGKGQKYLNSLNGILDRAVGGWAVNGVTTLMSGAPLEIGNGDHNNQTGNWNAGSLRPNVAASCNKTLGGSAQSRLNGWYNTACFVDQGNLTPQGKAGLATPVDPWGFGNEPRVDSTLRTSGMANWDFSLQKQTRITEGNNLEFRVEFYNIFNRRQWAAPGNDSSRGDFGTISDQQNAPRQIQGSLRFNF